MLGLGNLPASAKPRPSGGFNQSLGNFDEEHLEQSAMTQAVQQQAVSQQAVNPQTAQALAQQAATDQSTAPREVGSVIDEVVRRPISDIVEGVKQMVDPNTWLESLGISAANPDPAAKQKRAAVAERMKQLDADQARVVQEKVQEELQRKKIEEQEKEQRKAQEEQAKQSALPMPHKAASGPIGPASGHSRKADALAMLEQDRKTTNRVQGAN